LRIVFAGTTENAVDVLRYLTEVAKHEIVGVLTREDALVGRKQTLTPSPVAQYAESMGLIVLRANRITESVNEQLLKLDAELGVVVAYGALLKRTTLDIARQGWINIHYSILPRLRGAAPVQRALINGDREIGVTVFQLDEGMDTGPIHAQLQTVIEPTENAGELLERLTTLAVTMLDEILAKIDAGFSQTVQQIGEATTAPKLSRSECKINFEKTSLEIEGLVRGCNPEPMAWAEHEGEPIRVLRARAVESSAIELTALPTGTVQQLGSRILVTAADQSLLELLEVQPASKRVMSAADWHRGLSGSVKLS
jgi:methionyl-tRNA formyltransferase